MQPPMCDTPSGLRGLRAAWRPRGAPAGQGSLRTRLLASRGVEQAQVDRFLSAGLAELRPARDLPGATGVAELILRHARAGARIVVFGDYDADGTAAAATVRHTLRCVAPSADVRIEIPHRRDGYGLTDAAVARVLAHGPALVVTVDCGISSVEHVTALRSAGPEVAIIDHHPLRHDGALPPANAIAHPQLPGSDYGNPDLCACAVAWKVCCEVARLHAGESMNAELRRRLATLLSLAAVASVADVIPLRGETRVIVKHGLDWFRSSDLPGVRAIAARVAELGRIRSEGVAFTIGPVLNAAGRMGHAGVVAELLALAPDDPDSHDRASAIIGELKILNAERKALQARLEQDVLGRVAADGLSGDAPCAVVLCDAQWPHALVGILAAKVVERTGRPAVLGHVQPDGRVRCSARSVPGWDVGRAITRLGGLIDSGGGHAMAAGASVRPGAFDAFACALRESASAALAGRTLEPIMEWDLQANLSDMSLTEIDALQACGPFGSGNPQPAFLFRNCRLAEDARHMKLGSPHAILALSQLSQLSQASHGVAPMKGIWFGAGELVGRLRRGVACSVLAAASINEWNGRRTAELQVLDLSPE